MPDDQGESRFVERHNDYVTEGIDLNEPERQKELDQVMFQMHRAAVADDQRRPRSLDKGVEAPSWKNKKSSATSNLETVFFLVVICVALFSWYSFFSRSFLS